MLLSKNLAPVRADALAKIDRETGVVRLLFITDSPGQQMVYLRKQQAAEAYLANPEIPVGEISAITGEAADEGLDLMAKAVQIVSQAYSWAYVSDLIERRRLAAKRAVDAATNPVEILASATVDWSDIRSLAS